LFVEAIKNCNLFAFSSTSAENLNLNEWLRSTVGRTVLHLCGLPSLVGELTLSCPRPAADGWPLYG